ncbi:MAG: endoribonuclease YicC domain-containing protein [Hydrogenobaculum sp.]
MTGFAQKTAEVNGFSITLTLKSVNGKGLDISVKISSQDFQILETYIKDRIKNYLTRGTVLVSIDLKQKKDIKDIDVGFLENIIKDLKEACNRLNISLTDDKIFDIAMETYKTSQEKDEETKERIKDTILTLFEEALREFIESKEKEGEFLLKDIKSRVELLEEYLLKARENFKEYENASREKILEKAKSLNLEEQNPLVINELMLLLQKLDISEELSRIENHLNHMLDIISSEQVEKGKKIEFVAQELHREITTMSNKVPELSRIAVNMKYETDKIKQQSANLE